MIYLSKLASRKHTTLRRPRRGIFLVEAILSIAIITASGTLFVHLMRSSLHATDVNRADATALTQKHGMLDILRRDVWSAADVKLVDAHSLVLNQSNGRSVRWKFEAQSSTRVEDGAKTPSGQIEFLVGGTSVAKDGSNIIVTLGGSGDAQSCLACQMLLQKGNQP
jgi:hypothetical protein